MDREKKAIALYKKILLDNNIDLITLVYIAFCLDQSLNAYDMDLIIKDDEKEKLIDLILDYYLNTDIQISKICDIICEHYNEIEKDNFNIYDYTETLY